MSSRFYWIGLIVGQVALPLHGQDGEEANIRSKEFIQANDFEQAIPLLKIAAEKGVAEAQYNYGYCFESGTGLPENDSVANIWYLKAAEQGWLDAQFKLGYSYALGRGITKDMSKSYYWTLQCAQQDDPECMFNLITCYYNGTGTGQSIDSVLTWARRLACMDTPENLNISGIITSARLNLAHLYDDGTHLPRDPMLSYAWYLVYNESKRDHSILVQEQHIENIQRLEMELSENQEVTARATAERLLGRGLKNLSNLHEANH